MTLDLAKLRALAEAATPGPWKWGERREQFFNLYGAKYTVVAYSGPFEIDTSNREYIAAANPAAVLSLLDRVRLLERLLDDACLTLARGHMNDAAKRIREEAGL